MDRHDQQKYRKLYRDVLRGFSEFKYSDKTIYVKHFKETDLGDIEDIDEKTLAEAKKEGVPTEEEKIELLKRDELWSDEKDRDIKALEESLVPLRQTRGKLVLKHQIKSQDKRIQKTEDQLDDLLSEKSRLVGYTAETYVQKRVASEYLRHSLFKDKKIDQKFFTEEEFYDVSDIELTDITLANNRAMSLLSLDEVKNLAACSFFINAISISKKDPYVFYGTPIAQLTNYQMDLFSHGLRFISVLEEGKSPSEYDVQNAPRLRKWYEAMLEARQNKGVKGKKSNKENQGGTIFGADEHELRNLMDDDGTPVVDLQKEIAKRGRNLTMGDMIEIHGHGKKGENIQVR